MKVPNARVAVMLTAFLSMVCGEAATTMETQAILAQVMQTKQLVGMLQITLDAHEIQADATDTTLAIIRTYSEAAKTTLDAHITGLGDQIALDRKSIENR